MDNNIAVISATEEQLLRHLIRKDKQEDICFALYKESLGKKTRTFLIREVILPNEDERRLEGTSVSIYERFFERALKEAVEKRSGLALLHSHPPKSRGHQELSENDYKLERRLAGKTKGHTGRNLVGMTVAREDLFWSGRTWEQEKNEFLSIDCLKVRLMREGAIVHHFHPSHPLTRADMKESKRQERTIQTWGKGTQARLRALNIGIVGLGSTGSVVAELLGRMGATNILLVDKDKVEEKNLDRHLSATREDVDKYKVDVVAGRLRLIATADDIQIHKIKRELNDFNAVPELLDCDVIFCCADSHKGRHCANQIALRCLIPIIEGGVGVVSDGKGGLKEVHIASRIVATAGKNQYCLECAGAVIREEISREDRQFYMPADVQAGVSAAPYSFMAGTLHITQFMSMVSGMLNLKDFNILKVQYTNDDSARRIACLDRVLNCHPDCLNRDIVALGNN